MAFPFPLVDCCMTQQMPTLRRDVVARPRQKPPTTLRVALVLGFNAVEAYVNTVSDQFEVRFSQTSAPLDKRIEHLFRSLSTEPLDQASSYWKEFKLALKLRDQLPHLRTRSRFDVGATEQALQHSKITKCAEQRRLQIWLDVNADRGQRAPNVFFPPP